MRAGTPMRGMTSGTRMSSVIFHVFAGDPLCGRRGCEMVVVVVAVVVVAVLLAFAL